MLSVLIPVYNYDVRNFIRDVQIQCSKSGVEFEIICLEDGSTKEFVKTNKSVGDLPDTIHDVVEINVGRSKIRNILAERSRFKYLLFADCDSAVEDDQFIERYLSQVKTTELTYGGRSYSESAPDKNYSLHWKYGVNRECKSAGNRQKNPHRSFMTNNFVIPRSLFEQIRFDETITGYGHEDTLFGKELGKRNIGINHINNPLRHIGLETNEEFIEKTREAVQNLVKLYKAGKLDRSDVRLIQAYHTVKSFGFKKIVSRSIQKREHQILEQLKKPDPSLRLYDQWKLMMFIQLMQD